MSGTQIQLLYMLFCVDGDEHFTGIQHALRLRLPVGSTHIQLLSAFQPFTERAFMEVSRGIVGNERPLKRALMPDFSSARIAKESLAKRTKRRRYLVSDGTTV